MDLMILNFFIGLCAALLWAIDTKLQKILKELQGINGNTLGLYRHSGGEG